MSGHELNDPFARSLATLHRFRVFLYFGDGVFGIFILICLLQAGTVLATPAPSGKSKSNLDVVIDTVQLCIAVVELIAVIAFQHHRRNTTFVPHFFILLLASAEIAFGVFSVREKFAFPAFIICCGVYHWITIVAVAALRPFRLWDVYQPIVSHSRRSNSSLGFDIPSCNSTVLSKLAEQHRSRPYPVVPVSTTNPNVGSNSLSNGTRNAQTGPQFDPVVYYWAGAAETRYKSQRNDHIRQWCVAVYLICDVFAVVGSQALSESSVDGKPTQLPRWLFLLGLVSLLLQVAWLSVLLLLVRRRVLPNRLVTGTLELGRLTTWISAMVALFSFLVSVVRLAIVMKMIFTSKDEDFGSPGYGRLMIVIPGFLGLFVALAPIWSLFKFAFPYKRGLVSIP